MTKSLAVADLQKFLLGFDRFVNDSNVFSSTLDGGYPRFNIVRVGEHGFRVELAVPGWNKKDIEINLHKGLLTVEGAHKQEENPNETYIHKGLSGKCFKRTFGVSEHIKIDRAYMERGLLCIDLHEELPNELQPHKVTIEQEIYEVAYKAIQTSYCWNDDTIYRSWRSDVISKRGNGSTRYIC